MLLMAIEHIMIQSILYDNYNIVHNKNLPYDLQKVKDIMDRFAKDVQTEFTLMSQTKNEKNNYSNFVILID